MNDKALVQTLQNIKDYCTGQSCKDCNFHNEKYAPCTCQLKRLVGAMYSAPQWWDMKKIVEIINE